MADNIFVKAGIDEIANAARTGDSRAIKTMRAINEARDTPNSDYKVYNAILSYYEKDQTPSQPNSKSSPKPKKSKDFAQILIEAETGDALSQFILGNMYDEGIGVTANPRLAELWYGKSADQGNADAMNNLGVIKLDSADYDAAEKLFSKSLEIVRQNFGNSHPDIAAILNNIATLYLNKGEHDRALPLH
ncbi:MAG: tetratricopeptide repeat protein, partial [Alphaproteobacteria bacterium]|nr:tetratricopeptide repeat protein [Alphaproteobacteria bacterium]